MIFVSHALWPKFIVKCVAPFFAWTKFPSRDKMFLATLVALAAFAAAFPVSNDALVVALPQQLNVGAPIPTDRTPIAKTNLKQDASNAVSVRSEKSR